MLTKLILLPSEAGVGGLSWEAAEMRQGMDQCVVAVRKGMCSKSVLEEKSARPADGFDMESGREGGEELRKSPWFQVLAAGWVVVHVC